jgi:hypothetical protein
MRLAGQAHPLGDVVEAESGLCHEKKCFRLWVKGHLRHPFGLCQSPLHALHTAHSQQTATAWESFHRHHEAVLPLRTLHG